MTEYSALSHTFRHYLTIVEGNALNVSVHLNLEMTVPLADTLG